MRLAREYHLRGEVWNSMDGSVGAVLQSENAGPGSVDAVESHKASDDEAYDGFSVSYKRAI